LYIFVTFEEINRHKTSLSTKEEQTEKILVPS